MEDNDVRVTPARGWWALPVGIIAAIMLLGIIGVAIDDDGTNVAATSSASTTSSSSTSTTILFTTQTTEAFATSTTSGATTTVATTATTTATTVAAASCRNSTNTSCGAFRFDPAPAANRPISITVKGDDETPSVGQELLFTATATDPDASPIKEGACGNSTGMSFGDSAAIPTSCSTPCAAARYGPWTPPAASQGTKTFQYRHTYAAPGTYTITVVFASADPCNPYGSVHHLTFPITVTA